MDASISQVTDLIARLDAAQISYQLDSVRAGALLLSVAVPGERWEIEFLADGRVEIEVFRSDGTMYDGRELDRLFNRFSDA